MIESAMFVALGALGAILCALLVIPALNRRAERLARRRVEALFPLSIEELNAEKDHLRAEFAVEQRRLERKAEEALEVKRTTMEELGQRAVRIEALATDLAARDGQIAELTATLHDTRGRLASTEEELAATRQSLSHGRETLTALQDSHRRTLDELATTRGELDTTTTRLNETRTQLDTTRERLSAREGEFADLLRRHNETLSDLDARRITISDLETRLATQTTRGDEFERALNDRRTELSAERQRLADLAKGVVAEQERGLVLEQRIRALEAERDRKASEAAALADDLAALKTTRDTLLATLDERSTSSRAAEEELARTRARIAEMEQAGGALGATHSSELRTAGDQLAVVRAEKSSLEGALAAAREERTRLERELQAARRLAEEQSAAIRAENAELRRRIDEVADDVLRAAGAATDGAPDGAAAAAKAGQRGAKRPATA